MHGIIAGRIHENEQCQYNESHIPAHAIFTSQAGMGHIAWSEPDVGSA